MMNSTQPHERLANGPSALEAERAEVIHDLERYFEVLTSNAATPIVREVAAVLAFERLDALHGLDTRDT